MENQREIHMKHKKGRRLILFPLPLQGHINPMFQLASILYCKGFSITIIHTQFNSPNSTNYPHFEFHSIPDGLLKTETSTADVVALLSLLNLKCVAPFRDCLANLLSSNNIEEDHEPIACLISDGVWHCTQSVAESFNLPRIVLRTNSISSFLSFAVYFLPIQGSQSEALVPELPPLRVKEIPTIETNNTETLLQSVQDIVNQTKSSSGCIGNTCQGLEEVSITTFNEAFSVPLFSIGPFHKYFPASSTSLLSQDQTSIPWLDKQSPKSVIYVSFGSIAAITETELTEIAFGLANCKLPFLWVVRPGLVHGAEWLEALPKGFIDSVDGRGHIVKWAPQQEVLAHPAIGGFWTHNGWNSTLESICEGVPMICQPCFGDQLVNARYVSHVWRVGLHLERKLERGEIERAIRRVIVEAEGQEIRERIKCLKEKVDDCLRQGGSSYQSLENLINYIMSF